MTGKCKNLKTEKHAKVFIKRAKNSNLLKTAKMKISPRGDSIRSEMNGSVRAFIRHKYEQCRDIATKARAKSTRDMLMRSGSHWSARR